MKGWSLEHLLWLVMAHLLMPHGALTAQQLPSATQQHGMQEGSTRGGGMAYFQNCPQGHGEALRRWVAIACLTLVVCNSEYVNTKCDLTSHLCFAGLHHSHAIIAHPKLQRQV